MNKASLCFPGMEKAVFKGCVLAKSIWEKRGWEPKGETRKLSSSLLLGEVFKLKISPTQWVLAGSEELIGACTVWIYELVAVIPCAWIPEEGSCITWGC